MPPSEWSESCVKCKKLIKNTEIVLVCGLWCRKSYHNQCLGLSNREARALTCSKVRIKFHCDGCEKRLGTEPFGEKESQQPKNVPNCVNNCVTLLELVQKLVKITTDLSNDNCSINSKLDTVLSSNARIEEHLLRPPKCFKNRSEETFDNTVDDVGSGSSERIFEIRDQNVTNSSNQSIENIQIRCCASELQETDDSLLRVPSDFPEQITPQHTRLQQNSSEDYSSNCQQEWEVPDGHDSTHDPLITCKQECSPPEDFLVSSTFSVEKTENVEDEERTMIEADGENHSSSQDFLGPNTVSIQRTVHEEAEEPVDEQNFMEVKQEVEPTIDDGGPESSFPIGLEDCKSNDSGGLDKNVSLLTRIGNRIRHTRKHKVDGCGYEIGARNLGYRCAIYKKMSAQLQELKDHKHVGRRKVIHSCNVCHKTFTRCSGLNVHFLQHASERHYSCTVCNKTFTRSNQLKEHSRLHIGKRPYSCSVCNKAFTSSGNLKQHSRSHTGERPYCCDVCSKTFVHLHQLKQHSRMHTGERPYSCSVCNKAFTSSSNLKLHSRTHTGERPYCCDVCSKTFVLLHHLKRHSRLHTGVRPYSCSVCSKTFVQCLQRKQHVTESHTPVAFPARHSEQEAN